MYQSILEFISMNRTLVTVASSVALAFIGYIVKYRNDLAIARRRDRLDRVNAQLRLLYGPLFALTVATARAWKEFRKKYKPGEPFFSLSRPPNPPELAAWRLWMTKAFMPLNRRMVETIVSNADLLDGEMPPEFLELVAHVSAYEVVLARWEANDFSEHAPANDFPRAIEQRVKEDYDKLRAKQLSLLASRRMRESPNGKVEKTTSPPPPPS
jgi:hypothetical protein